MHTLTGYCDRWSARPGETLRFMVSSAADAPFTLRFVRHLCADPNPAGPGYTEIPMPTALDGERPGRFQDARPGSYAVASGLAGTAAAGLAVSATVWPTAPGRGEQVILSVDAGAWTLRLGIDAAGRAFVATVDGNGDGGRAEVAAPMLARRWYDLAAGHDAAGRLWVRQSPRHPVARIADGGEASHPVASMPGAGPFAVTIAAHRERRAFFNGKVERPAVWQGPIGPGTLLERQRRRLPERGAPGLVAMWDFAQGIGTQRAPDLGPGGADAVLHNLPTRAMTGSHWDGTVHDWRQAPDQYGAIHFHDDDVGDLGWDETAALTIPADWPSGFYAAHIRNGAGEDMIPFFVRPAQPQADVLLLAPTYTYQVYGCHNRPGRGADIRERALAWGALAETPDMNPQFGLSTYNAHSDGSGVSLVTSRRPMLDTRPRHMALPDPAAEGSGTSRICADSYIVHFLAQAGVAHDVATDHDLHEDGAALLAPYRVVIAAQHPEYYSERMMAAMEAYLAGGGRLMYLGGNGFYWRCEPSADAPDALEVRRAENGIRTWATEPGETHHAFGTGGLAGLWRHIGRPAHRLVGSGFSAQGRQLGFPYRWTEAIHDPRVAFMRAGMDPQPGEAFGERGFMGGGAVGFELDSVDPHHGTPPNALVVAKGIVIHPDYHPVNEDRLAVALPKRTEDWSCADLVFFETPSGGAVFSVGSMTYVGSLGIDGYDNPVARLTANVVRRFRDPAPFD